MKFGCVSAVITRWFIISHCSYVCDVCAAVYVFEYFHCVIFFICVFVFILWCHLAFQFVCMSYLYWCTTSTLMFPCETRAIKISWFVCVLVRGEFDHFRWFTRWKNLWWIAQELRKDHTQNINKPRTLAHRNAKAPNRAPVKLFQWFSVICRCYKRETCVICLLIVSGNSSMNMITATFSQTNTDIPHIFHTDNKDYANYAKII